MHVRPYKGCYGFVNKGGLTAYANDESLYLDLIIIYRKTLCLIKQTKLIFTYYSHIIYLYTLNNENKIDVIKNIAHLL